MPTYKCRHLGAKMVTDRYRSVEASPICSDIAQHCHCCYFPDHCVAKKDRLEM